MRARLRRTKIVASLGPATDDPVVMAELVRQGVDVVRLNFSHGGEADHMARIELVRRHAAGQGRAVGILGDLQGPKIRIEGFKDGRVDLQEGDGFCLDLRLGPHDGERHRVGVTYKDLPVDVRRGDTLLLDDGNVALWVEQVSNDEIQTRVVVGGELSDNKGINRQGGGLSAPALTPRDHDDIRFAARAGLDYIGVSFVRNADDIRLAREIVRGAGSEAGIVAKIERAEAIDHIEAIIDAADAVMIARGDLGVEIGDADLPGVQKRVIALARSRNSVVIVATQMMQSMIESSQPTRAEVLDVANAVLDGTDAVMLSAETAIGRHPARVVAAMDRVCRGAERHRSAMESSHRLEARFQTPEEAIAMAAMYTANHFDVEAILALTESGATARWMSRISSGIPIYAATRNPATERRSALYRGVYPFAFDATGVPVGHVNYEAVAELQRRGAVREGDRIIITKGDLSGVAGGTNAMKVVKVGEVARTG